MSLSFLYGIPVWYGSGRLDDCIELALKEGFDYVEVSLDYPWPEKLNSLILERVLRLTREMGVKIGVHGPWRDIALASPRESLRRASLKIYRKCINFAYKVEAVYFNFHICTREALDYEDIYDDVKYATMLSLKEICRMCNEVGIIPLLENNPYDFLSSLDEIKELLDETENLMLCFDTGHLGVAQVEKRRKKQKSESFDDWLMKLRSRILTVHLHDYRLENERVIDHLLLGKGEMNLEHILNLIKRTNIQYILLEIFWSERGKRAKINELRNVLISLRNILG